MTRLLLAVIALASVVGCSTTPKLSHEQSCANQGYARGSSDFTECVRYSAGVEQRVASKSGSSTPARRKPGDPFPTDEQVIGSAKDSDYEFRLYNSGCPFPDLINQYPLKFWARQLSDGKAAVGCFTYNVQTQQITLASKSSQPMIVPASVFIPGAVSSAPKKSFLEALGDALSAIGSSAQQASAVANAGMYNAAAGNNQPVIVGGDSGKIEERGRFNNQPNATCVTTINGMQVSVPCKY